MPERSEYNEHPGAVHRLVTFIIDMVFVALVYVPLTLLVTFLFYWAAELCRTVISCCSVDI